MGFFKELGRVFHAMADDAGSGNGDLSPEEKEKLAEVEKNTNKKIVPPVKIDHQKAQKDSQKPQENEGNKGKEEK